MKKKNVLFIILGLFVISGAVYFGHPHKYKDTMITEPICTTEGTMQYACWCGNNYTEQLEALGHTYEGEITVEATCTEKGVNTYTCTACGDSYAEELDALGHDLKTDIKEATCEEAGCEKSACSRCDYVEEEMFEALGHDYELTEESKTEKIYVCVNCEDSYTEKIKTKSGASTGGGYSEAQRQADLEKLAALGAITGGGQQGEVTQAYVDSNAAENAGIDTSGVVLH